MHKFMIFALQINYLDDFLIKIHNWGGFSIKMNYLGDFVLKVTFLKMFSPGGQPAREKQASKVSRLVEDNFFMQKTLTNSRNNA